MNVNIAMCPFVPNFLNCVSAKYDLNWFTVGKVGTKIKRVVNFLLKHSVVITMYHHFKDLLH